MTKLERLHLWWLQMQWPHIHTSKRATEVHDLIVACNGLNQDSATVIRQLAKLVELLRKKEKSC